MNRTVARLSAQALFGSRRGIVLMLIPGALLALSVIVRVLTDAEVGIEVAMGLGFTLALPLVALLAATAVLGPEIDDGSVVYLLSKPVSRHVIAISKYAAAWAATMVLGALPLFLSGLVLDVSETRRAVALGVGAAVAGTAYCALFIGLAALTRHAVVIGLLFTLLWEGVFGGVFGGVKWVSIGPWGREVASWVSPLVDPVGLGVTYAVGRDDPGHRGVGVVHRRPAALVHPAGGRVASRRVWCACPCRASGGPRAAGAPSGSLRRARRGWEPSGMADLHPRRALDPDVTGSRRSRHPGIPAK